MVQESLAATAAQQQQLEPISAHVDKLGTQLADNRAILDDLDRNTANIAALRTAADGLRHDAGLDDENAAQGTALVCCVFVQFDLVDLVHLMIRRQCR